VQQSHIARALNQADCLYRFISEPTKLLSAVPLFQPDLLMLHGDVSSELLRDALDTLYSNPSFAQLPIALLSSDDEDEVFVQGFKTGVVALLREPFAETHVSRIIHLLDELPSRPGISSGISDSCSLARLVEHLRKTRRTGSLTISDDKGTVANAEFEVGKLTFAQYHELRDMEALVNLVTLPKATWVVKEHPHTQTTIPPAPRVVSEQAEARMDADELSESWDQITPAVSVPVEEESEQSWPLNVLLADNDPLLIQKIASVFQKHSIQITPANNGIEVYQLALTGKFDLILCSLNLWGLDGWGALGLIREDFRTRELPVILLTDDEKTCEWLQTSEIEAHAYASRLADQESLRLLLYHTLQPRYQLIKRIERKEDFSVALGEVGIQWLIRTFKTYEFSGCIEATTSSMHLQVFFSKGEAVYAAAQAGKHSAEAEIAFNALVSLGNTEAKLFFDAVFPSTNLSLSTEVMLVRAALKLNAAESQQREKAFTKARRVEVKPNLYVLFQRFGPKSHLPWISLICESKLTPKEVLARANISPVQLEEIVGDLVRRKVLRLSR
jgi:CheY-like chemotaxis protein